MQVGLIGCWHDDNRGDSAILFGILNDLYEISPDLKVKAYSLFSDPQGPFRTAFRHVQANFPGLVVYPSPLPDIYDPNLNLLGRTRRAGRLLYSILRNSASNSDQIWCDLIRNDLIISVGGYRLKSPKGNLVDLIRIIFHAFPFLLFRKFGKKYVLDAQSIGPLKGNIHRNIVRKALQDAMIIGLRESISYQEVRDLGLTSNLKLVPDAAFSLNPCLSDRVINFLRDYRLMNRPYVVLAPRQWFWNRRDDYLAYEDTIVNFIKMIKRIGYVPVLVSHSIGPISIEDDRILCQNIAYKAKNHDLVINDADWNPSELAAFYGCAAAVIGVRLHAVVLALLSGVPSIAIAYEGPKTQGIMRYLGLESFVIPIGSLTFDELLRKFESLHHTKESIQNNIIKKVEIARVERLNFVKEIIEAI